MDPTRYLRERKGQRVRVVSTAYPQLAGQTFEIEKAIIPPGSEKVLMILKDKAGRTLKHHTGADWLIEQADVEPAPPETPQAPHKDLHMNHEQMLIQTATAIAAEERIDLGSATKRAALKLKAHAEGHINAARTSDSPVDNSAVGVVFDQLVAARVQAGESWRDAVRSVSATYPNLAARR